MIGKERLHLLAIPHLLQLFPIRERHGTEMIEHEFNQAAIPVDSSEPREEVGVHHGGVFIIHPRIPTPTGSLSSVLPQRLPEC